MTAQDNVGNNQQFASATVIVTVLRDLFSPLFLNLPGSVTLDEQQAINRTVYTVTATDNDLEVRALAFVMKHSTLAQCISMGYTITAQRGRGNGIRYHSDVLTATSWLVQ